MEPKIKLLRLTLLAILIQGCASGAYSCTCGESTVPQQRDSASAVFMGTPVKKVRSDAVEGHGVEITFQVRRVWKGQIGQQTVVYTGATSDLYDFENLCAPPFKIGQFYVVFALGAGKLTTDVCAGTLPVAEGKSTIRQLGKSYRAASRVSIRRSLRTTEKSTTPIRRTRTSAMGLVMTRRGI